MSRTATVGKLPFSCVHFAPPFVLNHSPYSVPTKIRLGFTVSSAIASTVPFSGRLFAIDVLVLPASVDLNRYGLQSEFLWLSNAAYTVFASCVDAASRLTYVFSGTPENLSIFDQFAPPSLVIWISPSSVPTYSCPSFFGDSASATMFP